MFPLRGKTQMAPLSLSLGCLAHLRAGREPKEYTTNNNTTMNTTRTSNKASMWTFNL